MSVVVRAIAATLPAGVRARYREEWLSDVAGADELGVSRAGVVIGALGIAASIDRENPDVSGMTPRRLAFRRLRVGLAMAATALLLLMGSLLWAQQWALLLAVVTGAVAIVAFLGASRASRRGRARRRWTVADTAVAVTAPLAVAATVLVPFIGVPMVFAVILGLVVVVAVEDPRRQGDPLSRPQAALLAVLSASAILAMLAGSLLHIYIWNPLARMPGMTLDEIYTGLSAAGEPPSTVVPIGWAVAWGLIALALVVSAVLPYPRVRRLMTARRIAGIGILGVALVAGGSWFVGFDMGMGMADAFMTSGGDAATSGPMLSLVGFCFAIAALLVGLLPTRLGVMEAVG